ncbi:MAG: type II toxin-antitoxin system Phd/YefM family antitoxin [Spirochaetia bacterium]|jgi:PHD/YefM family antitoxin component YafN of YafNO toxin-antitoxin module|nr:type II toxin-antitoxin system Phd/YefM family antitoxin [Spirochaetia bacterium]
MPQIRPIKDLRDTTEISRLCHKIKEPIFITKNGYGDMVVMSIQTYEMTMAKLDLYQKLSEAEEEVNSGKELMDAEVVFDKLRKKYVS